MQLHQALSAIACAGYLAFAILALRRASQSPLASALAVLLLAVFAWSFAQLAQQLTGERQWALVDRFFASLLPALALLVTGLFVGRAKALRRLLIGAYLAFGSLALLSTFVPLRHGLWWPLLLAGACVTMAYAAQLLVAHARRSVDPAERARTRLLLIAIVIATLVGSSDLWLDKVGLPRLRLSDLGMFMAMALFATAALRLDLLGAALPTPVLAYAALGAVAAVVAYLAAVRRWHGSSVPAALGAASTALLIGFALRELGRIRSLARDQTQRLMLFGRWSEQLAHDLKNPLAALKGAVQFLNEEHASGRSHDLQASYLGFMLEQCNRLQHNVEVYQRLAKVEPLLAQVSLNDVVAHVLALQGFALKPAISLRQVLGEGLPDCRIDRNLVATALENMLQNADEALSGAGTVWVRTELASESPEAVVLSVEDDGPGIDPRLAERVTEAFVTTKPGGSGLGLAFAARVAKAHGGRLSIDTALGRGTVVRMSFPVAG